MDIKQAEKNFTKADAKWTDAVNALLKAVNDYKAGKVTGAGLDRTYGKVQATEQARAKAATNLDTATTSVRNTARVRNGGGLW